MRWTTSLVVLVLLLGASPRRPGWSDPEGDGFDTREQLLLERCQVIAVKGSIRWARCLDGYTGAIIESSAPSDEIEIDHLVPWSVARDRLGLGKVGLARFYNDSRNLVITTREANRSKAALMPDRWCPPTPPARRSMAARMELVVDLYGLKLTTEERAGLDAWHLGGCLVVGSSSLETEAQPFTG